MNNNNNSNNNIILPFPLIIHLIMSETKRVAAKHWRRCWSNLKFGSVGCAAGTGDPDVPITPHPPQGMSHPASTGWRRLLVAHLGGRWGFSPQEMEPSDPAPWAPHQPFPRALQVPERWHPRGTRRTNLGTPEMVTREAAEPPGGIGERERTSPGSRGDAAPGQMGFRKRQNRPHQPH